MDAYTFLQRMEGRWRGAYRLWLDPEMDSEDSETTAEVRFVAAGKYLLFTYTWVQGGNNQEGVFLLGGDNHKMSATWGDSWHMAQHPMICEGLFEDDAHKFVLNGQYPAGEEQWGWRTDLILKDAETLVMEAYNISPQGQEMLAVRSEMERVPDGESG